MADEHKHDYSQIRVPVLALVGYPELPENQIVKNNVTNAEDRIIIEAVFGTYVGMTKNRIKRIKQAAGGPHVVELWGANHFAFLSNEADVLREFRAFQGTLQSRRKTRSPILWPTSPGADRGAGDSCG